MSKNIMKIEQLLSNTNTRVFIDTCTLMNHRILELFDKIIPILKNNKLVVPESCIKELAKHKENPKLESKVKNALEALELIAENVSVKGNQMDGTFADNVFLRVFTQFRTRYQLVLITEDKNLKADILQLNESKSVKGHHVFVLGIDDILKPSTTKKKNAHEFHVDTRMTTEPDAPILVVDVPNEGDTVYDKDKNPVLLTKEINAGGEGIVYSTNLSEQIVAKIYFCNKLTNHKKCKIDEIIASAISIKGVCFPKAQLYTQKGEFVGYLMPKAEGRKLDGTVFKGEVGMNRYFGDWSRDHLVTLALTICKTIKKIHDKGILIGDINGANILVKSPTEVYFVDTDSFQINGFPCPVGTADFTAPEIQGKDYKSFLRTIGNENFAVATLLFKIMMFGLHPYAQQGGADVAHNIKTGNFSFPYKEKSNNKIPKGDWCFFWSHLFFLLKKHFYETFRKDEEMFEETKRPDVSIWIKDLRFYQKQLTDGTLEGIDKESLKMFPKTYKKQKGVVYRTCSICKEEKPEDMFGDKGYCKACMYGTSSAKCKVCGKDFTFKTMIGIKSGFDSPLATICKECRRDKKKKEEDEVWTGIENEAKKAREKEEKDRKRREEERRKRQEYKNMVYQTITCSVCHKQFNITNGERDYFHSKGLELPKRCPDCIRGNKRPTQNNSGGCFITTAACEYYGKDDDCYELTMLRCFRDQWLRKQKNGDVEIALYYECAPDLVERMKASPDYASTCEELMNKYIRPCVKLIETYQLEACHQLYIKGLEYMMNKYK